MASAALRIVLDLEHPGELLERNYPNGRLGGLRFEGRAPGPVGHAVSLRVRFARPAREFTIRGQLAWARKKSSITLAQSYGVDVVPGDEPARQRLLAFARSELTDDITRYAPRVPVALLARIVHEGTTRKEYLADLSPGGAFVRTPSLLPIDARVELSVRPPRSIRRLKVMGRVAWVRRTGPDAGMGIAFLDADAPTRARIDRLLDRLGRD
ncbi:MAG: TIGR02266 family protein [Archangium sp.]|nr:TIGR02266 family protein [Archangium sp.]